MKNKSKVAFLITATIWLFTLLFSICFFTSTGGYSILGLILLPISLLIYLGNYYGREEKTK